MTCGISYSNSAQISTSVIRKIIIYNYINKLNKSHLLRKLQGTVAVARFRRHEAKRMSVWDRNVFKKLSKNASPSFWNHNFFPNFHSIWMTLESVEYRDTDFCGSRWRSQRKTQMLGSQFTSESTPKFQIAVVSFSAIFFGVLGFHMRSVSRTKIEITTRTT